MAPTDCGAGRQFADPAAVTKERRGSVDVPSRRAGSLRDCQVMARDVVLTSRRDHMAGFKVGYFVGSLATKSINRLLAKALVELRRQNSS